MKISAISGFHGVALSSTVSKKNWNMRVLAFVEGGKTGTKRAGMRTKKQNPHMASTPGIKPKSQ